MRNLSTLAKPRRRRAGTRPSHLELLEARTLLSASVTQAFSFGSTTQGEDIITGLAVDANGARYVTGHFSHAMTLGTGNSAVTLISNGGSDIYVAAFSADNTLLWATSYGGAGDEFGGGIVLANSSVYVTGTFQGSFDADPSAGTTNVNSNGLNDIIISRFTTAGTFQFARTIGGGGSDTAPRITADSTGNLYLLGSYSGSADLDPGAGNTTRNSTSPGGDLFISKLTAAGDLVWVNTYIYSDQLSIANIKLDSGGNIYFAGTVRGNADLDGTLAGTSNVSVASTTAFVAKLTNGGLLLAVTPFGSLQGGPNDDIKVTDLAVDSGGNIVVVGDFGGTVNVNPSGTTLLSESQSPNGLSGFVARLTIANNAVTLAWAGALTGDGTSDIFAVATDSGNNVFLAGGFASFVNFDLKASSNPQSSNTGQETPFVAKYDVAGNFLWEVHGSDSAVSSAATRMVLFQGGSPVVTGSYINSITFPTDTPTSFTPNSQDNFIIDVAQTPLSPTLTFTSSANSGLSGQTVTLTVTVTSNSGLPTGSVFFKDGAAVLGLVALGANGTATFNVTNIAAGNHSFTALYTGDTNFIPAAGGPTAVAIAQNKLPIGHLDSTANNALSGWAADLDSKNTPLVVQFWLDGKLYSTMSASNIRTDLQAVVGATNHGFVFQVPPLVAGTHTARLITYDPLTGAGVVIGTANIVSNSLYFDEAWYLRTYPDVAAAVASKSIASGWQHFITQGAHEGRNPSPFFDEMWYRSHNPDVNAAINAGKLSSGFAQFVAAGSREGRDPSPLFNEMYYRRAYSDIGAAVSAGTLFSGFTHFLVAGLVEGRSPTPWFDAANYRTRYSDVNTGMNTGAIRSAYDSFVNQGVAANRRPGPYYIDSDYLALNPDVAIAVSNHAVASGLVHFIRVGFFEGRTSYAPFDATWYLSQYPAATTAINAGQAKTPFQYFLLYGRLLGNSPAQNVPPDGTPVLAPTLLENLVGEVRPAINQADYRSWELKVQDAILDHAPIQRQTTYYFAVDGNDTTGTGAIDNPYRTLAKAQSLIDASSGNMRIHFLNHGRYSLETSNDFTNVLNSELVVNKPNITISADGTQFYYAYDDLGFYASSNFTWTQTAGKTFTYQTTFPSWATDKGDGNHGIGWIFEDQDQRRTSKPYTLAASPDEVEAHEGSFYVDRGNLADDSDDVLYVHIWSDGAFQGSFDPKSDGFHLNWIPSNSRALVRLMPGSDGSRVDGLDCIGFGLDPIAGKTSGFAVDSAVTGTDLVAISHVSAYYGSSKILVMESDGQAGGGTAFLWCSAGYANPNPGGQVTMNGFNGFGGQSFVAIGCRLFEALPTTGVQDGSGNGSIGGHTQSDNTPFAEILVMDCITDSLSGIRYPSGTSFNNVPAPSSRTAWGEYRATIDNFVSVKGATGADSNVAYLNCFDGAAGIGGKVSGIHINETFFWESNQDAGPTTPLFFADQPHDAWFFNCTFSTRGPWAFFLNAASAANSTGLRFYNSVFQNLLPVSSTNANYWNANLAAGEVFHNAIYNIATATNGLGTGYTGDPSLILLTAPISPGLAPTKESQLFKSAVASLGGLNLQYDHNWNQRPTTPSIGAYDVKA